MVSFSDRWFCLNDNIECTICTIYYGRGTLVSPRDTSPYTKGIQKQIKNNRTDGATTHYTQITI